MAARDKRIFIAGAGGMVGSSVARHLSKDGYRNLLTPLSNELDLTDQQAVLSFFRDASPAIVILAAAKVGGISANKSFPADFIYRNLMIGANVINTAFESGVEKLIFLSSSCTYPAVSPQPIREEALLTGPLEPTNEPYALAKIAGVKLCESYYRQHAANFYSLTPTNLYGPHDNFDLETAHVIPALIRKFHEAKVHGAESVEIWGSGEPRREFMHVDDLAGAIAFALEHIEAGDIYSQGVSHLNVGTGIDLTIRETAELIADLVGFDGTIVLDESRPNGAMQKLLDVTRLHAFGWRSGLELRSGLKAVYEWYASTASVPRSGSDGRINRSRVSSARLSNSC